ncbi:hypothetical protein TKK_0003857 [Trichogramma kaykai]|uniref:SHSP domain-containing protein n=1 Tax=Trichogramma kaykai TaxID=54128 RepID=A0ABD2XNV0_9HYME
MSLVPLLFSDWWSELDEPHYLTDQHFGLPLNPEDIIDRFAPVRSELQLYRPGRHHRHVSRYHPFLHSLMRKEGRGHSTVSADKDQFKVTLDVQQFSPEEINVKVVDNHVIVDAKHEEKKDEHGWISRQFTRKYMIPNQCEVDQVESRLSSDGVLTITAPTKKALENNKEKVIKVQYTGQPAIKEQEAHSSKEPQAEDNAQQRGGQRGKKSTVKAA